MMIYDEIKRLLEDGSNRMELIYTLEGIRTFEGSAAKYFEAQDFSALFSLKNNAVFSYGFSDYGNRDDIDIYVKTLTYEKEVDGIHVYSSYDCDMIKHPEDLELVVRCLEEQGYTEIAPFELDTLGYHMHKLDKGWESNLAFHDEENFNINIALGIPNKSHDYAPNEPMIEETNISKEIEYDDEER